MLRNFQLTAITKTGGRTRLFRIPLHQELQRLFAKNWHAQYQTFMNDVHEIDFDAGYNPEEHERFRLQEYVLPAWLINENSQTVLNLHPITQQEELLNSVTGMAAFAQNERGQEVILFQNFSRSHVIKPGRFLFLQNNTYESSEHPGLTLDWKLSAIYFPTEAKLLFINFRITNTFLPLADFYREASEQEILQVLNHDLFAPEDAATLASNANQWSRKRFAMLRESGILDNYSARQIKSRSKGYEIDIHIEHGKIVFPADKAAAKRLLQFLNEELYRGPITDTLYETNSKRESEQ